MTSYTYDYGIEGLRTNNQTMEALPERKLLTNSIFLYLYLLYISLYSCLDCFLDFFLFYYDDPGITASSEHRKLSLDGVTFRLLMFQLAHSFFLKFIRVLRFNFHLFIRELFFNCYVIRFKTQYRVNLWSHLKAFFFSNEKVRVQNWF